MAPPPALRKLTALQGARQVEIEGTCARLMVKPRASLNRNIVQTRIDAIKDVWAEVRSTHAEIVVRDDAADDPYMVDNTFVQIQGIYENPLDRKSVV